MKSVKDIATVAHNWANHIGGSAKASHLFFEGDNIYSYGRHFLIAKHVANGVGEKAVLMTTQKYSVSTSAHTTLVRRAANHLKIIPVPDPAMSKEEIFETWYKEMKALANCLDNASKPEKFLLEIQAVFEAVKRYAEFFRYEIPEMLAQASIIENGQQYAEVLRKEKELRKIQEQKQKAEALQRQKNDLKKWRGFETNYLSTVDGFDYLRFNNSSQMIETSQRVEISAETGRQFYAEILTVIAQGGCKKCDRKLMSMYDILEINARFIRVGCHKISIKEIKSFIKQLNWTI